MSGRVLDSHHDYYETERYKIDVERKDRTNARGKSASSKNRGREMQAVMNAPANHSMEEINELFDRPAQSLTAAGAKRRTQQIKPVKRKYPKNVSNSRDLGMADPVLQSARVRTKKLEV